MKLLQIETYMKPWCKVCYAETAQVIIENVVPGLNIYITSVGRGRIQIEAEDTIKIKEVITVYEGVDQFDLIDRLKVLGRQQNNKNLNDTMDLLRLNELL